MTKTFRYIIFLIATFIASPAMYAADTLDSDGYPVMYVRGHSTNNWSALDEYKFSRDGDVYTIHLDALDGEFKISGDNWQYNLGGHERTDITRSIRIQGVSDGKNFNAPNLRDLTISFKLLRENGAAGSSDITFTVGGAEIAGISGTLPVLYIDVYRYDSATGEPILDEAGNRIYDNEVIDKDLSHKNYFAGEYRLDVNGCQWLTDLGAASIGSEEAPLPLEIKARGNFTRRAFAKKPFKLKLGKKQNLLNMNVNGKGSKHWAILAHADDTKGYLRNFTGFALGERIGLPWTPRQQPIEVVINGDYRGLYFLTESIRVGDGRVPVEELDDNEENRTLISGGYIVELDNYDEDDSSQIQMEEKGKSDQFKDMLRITFDTAASSASSSPPSTTLSEMTPTTCGAIWISMTLPAITSLRKSSRTQSHITGRPILCATAARERSGISHRSGTAATDSTAIPTLISMTATPTATRGYRRCG